MKRELDIALPVDSELTSSLNGTLTQSLTPVDTQVNSCLNDVRESSNCERFTGTRLDGFIVYSRMKKSRVSNYDELLENNANIKKMQQLEVDNCRNNQVVNNVLDNQVVKMVVEESPVVTMEKSVVEESLVRTVTDSGDLRSDIKRKAPKRLTRSMMKMEPVEVLVTQSEGFESEEMSWIEVEAIAEGSALASPRKNLELKMSKKITLTKKPMTVTELFETGLLEGVTVVYMGGIKVDL